MKIKWNKKYTTVATYAFIVIALAVLFVVFVFRFDSFSKGFSWIGTVAAPIICGIVIAYVINPLVMWIERTFFRKLVEGTPPEKNIVMQKLSGQGLAFLELDGTVIEKTLAPGETLRVSTGHVALYEATVSYRAEMVRGFKNILFGGEGLFLTVLEGPGKIWVQSMCVAEFAAKMIPYIPSKRN